MLIYLNTWSLIVCEDLRGLALWEVLHFEVSKTQVTLCLVFLSQDVVSQLLLQCQACLPAAMHPATRSWILSL